MAFLPNQQRNQDQEQGQQGQLPQVPLIPTLQGSGGPTASQTGGVGVTNTATPARAPSSPWQNVSAYLQANAGQAGSVADVLSGNLTSQYNTANQGIQNAQQNFGQQIQSARTPYDQTLVDRAASSPSQVAGNAQDKAAFQKMLNAVYGGPQSFSTSGDYTNLAGQVEKAQKQAALVGQGTSGLMTLLQQAESAGGKNPTQGITALDSLLLQEDPSNFSKLNSAAQPFSNLTNYLSSTQQALDAQAQEAAQEAGATRSQTQNKFIGEGGVVPTFQNQLNTSLQGAADKAKGYNETIAGIIADLNQGKALQNDYPNFVGSNVDPSGILSTLNPYGTGGGVFNSMMGQGWVNPGYLTQFYDAPELLGMPGMENVMTPQQLADAQALNDLLGQNVIGAPSALGRPFEAPTSYGAFRGQSAAKGLYDTLKNMEGIVPQMDNLSQNSWLNNIKALSGLLGQEAPTTTPMPPPGSPGDLGAGFHWDESTGTWLPNIPRPTPPPTSGGGTVWI